MNQTPAREKWLVFTEPFFTDPNVFVTREEHPFISIGIALYPDHGATEQELFQHADMAMYSAKQDGRNTVRLFTP